MTRVITLIDQIHRFYLNEMIKKNDNNSKWIKVEKKNYDDMGKNLFVKQKTMLLNF